MKKQNLDNDYYFFDDGTILHHYDKTMTKQDFEEYVLPTEISTHEKELILTKCKDDCSNEIFNQIKLILQVK